MPLTQHSEDPADLIESYTFLSQMQEREQLSSILIQVINTVLIIHVHTSLTACVVLPLNPRDTINLLKSTITSLSLLFKVHGTHLSPVH